MGRAGIARRLAARDRGAVPERRAATPAGSASASTPASAASSKISGNGQPSRAIASHAATASAIANGVFNTRAPIRCTACTMIPSTAACRPNTTPATAGT